jgi:DNA-directed RNA polymerase subunit E'/Rpb7
MFFINHYLTTRLRFSHQEYDRLTSDAYVLRRIKKDFEGKCTQEFGYFIEIIPISKYQHTCGIHIENPELTSECILLTVVFNCLHFKRMSTTMQQTRRISLTSW